MSKLLQRLGGASAKHPLAVILLWVLLVAGVSGAAAALQRPFSTEFKIPGTQYSQVLDDLKRDFPAASGGHATIVVHNPNGPLTPAQQKAVQATVQQWGKAEGVKAATDPFTAQAVIDGKVPALQPKNQQEAAYAKRLKATLGDQRFVSADGTTALVNLTFDQEMVNVPLEQREHLQDLGQPLAGQGLQVEYSKDITENISSIIGPGEVLGVVVAGLILLLMLGSLLAAGMPLVLALVGVAVGVGGTIAAGHWITLQSISPALALMLGLAVGIDYTLFILNRHRTQMLQGMDRRRSIARATGTAGNSVVFAGLTVLIALAALVVTGIPFLGVIGLSAAVTVAIAVLAAITLAPALLSLLGHRVIGRRTWEKYGFTAQGEPVPGAAHLTEEVEHPEPRRGEAATTGAAPTPGASSTPGAPSTPGASSAPAPGAHPRGLAAWAHHVTRHPWLTVLATLLLLGSIAVPALDMRLGLPDGGAEPKDSTAYRAYTLTEEKFGAGANGPIVAMGTLPEGQTQQSAQMLQLATAEKLKAVPGVRAVVPMGRPGISTDNRTAAWQIVPEGGPADQSTVDLVKTLRDQQGPIAADTGVKVQVTGKTVADIDVSQKLADALPLYLAIVVSLSLLILLLVFRSVLVPVIATLGFLLSLAASLGAVVAIYQWGWLSSVFAVSKPEALLSFLPTLVIGVLFGLAMDYQMFLVSGMREAHQHGEDADTAVLTGFAHGRRVVTAAALIMISVFAGFVRAELTMIRPIGFALAIGVLVDAFLVRMTLTPAVMHLLGDRAWWIPHWLDRLLPDVDVEGAALTREDEAAGT